MGLLNIGFIVNFFSQTVLRYYRNSIKIICFFKKSGFISATAVIIICSQLKDLFGISIGEPQSFILM